jgi:hypothetical protein
MSRKSRLQAKRERQAKGKTNIGDPNMGRAIKKPKEGK